MVCDFDLGFKGFFVKVGIKVTILIVSLMGGFWVSFWLRRFFLRSRAFLRYRCTSWLNLLIFWLRGFLRPKLPFLTMRLWRIKVVLLRLKSSLFEIDGSIFDGISGGFYDLGWSWRSRLFILCPRELFLLKIVVGLLKVGGYFLKVECYFDNLDKTFRSPIFWYIGGNLRFWALIYQRSRHTFATHFLIKN